MNRSGIADVLLGQLGFTESLGGKPFRHRDASHGRLHGVALLTVAYL